MANSSPIIHDVELLHFGNKQKLSDIILVKGYKINGFIWFFLKN